MLAGPHQYFGSFRKPDIHARTEAYHTYALASNHGIAHCLPTNNTPRDPPGDLFEEHIPVVAQHVKLILLIFSRSPAAHGRIELSGAVFDGRDASGHRRTVDVHIEDREKHADPAARLAVARFLDHFHNTPVSRRNDHV